MLFVVEHQHPLIPGERTDIMTKQKLPPSGGSSDQPQGEVCPPVSTGGGVSFKTCSKCGMDKPVSSFHRQNRVRSGLQPMCIACKKAYRDATHEAHLRRGHEYQRRANEKIRTRKAQHHATNKLTINAARTARLSDQYRNDPSHRILKCLRVRLNKALTRGDKQQTTLALLGCTVQELWAHLASLFETGMTRENYGQWHVDHIRPCASFNLADQDQQKECFHWTNLQPLWAADNLKKWAHYNHQQKETTQ